MSRTVETLSFLAIRETLLLYISCLQQLYTGMINMYDLCCACS